MFDELFKSIKKIILKLKNELFIIFSLKYFIFHIIALFIIYYLYTNKFSINTSDIAISWIIFVIMSIYYFILSTYILSFYQTC